MSAQFSEVASPSPGALLQAITSQEDAEALAVLFRDFAWRIKTFYVQAGFSEAEAEELTIRMFVSLAKRAAGFQDQQVTAEAWLYSVARDIRCEARANSASTATKATGAGQGTTTRGDGPAADLSPLATRVAVMENLTELIARSIRQRCDDRTAFDELSRSTRRRIAASLELLRKTAPTPLWPQRQGTSWPDNADDLPPL